MAVLIERTDAGILAEAQDIVQRLRGRDPMGILLAVGVYQGRLTVSGNVATAAMAATIRESLETIPGVTEISDHIVDDDHLQSIVQSAFELEPESHAAGHKAHVVMGTVYIDWSDRDAMREQHVRDRLLLLPGVRAVVHGNWSAERRTA